MAKFTSATTIGNSNITDTGSLITLGSNTYLNGNLGIGTATLTQYSLRISKNITGAASSYGIIIDGEIQSDVTANAYYNRTTVSTVGSLGNLYHNFASQATFGSTVTAQTGFWASQTLIGATNNYGFYGDIPAQANAWNIYMGGTANNYMAGSLGIGNTTLTGYSLRVSKTMTGATTAIGIRSDGAIQSDVTTSGYYFRTAAASAAASFTLAGLYHYSAATSGFGAGSTINNQYGFQVDSNMTGATNNYGFLGALASAANTWNIYMSGTANNYMAGSLGIGRTALSNMSLGIDKNMTGGVTVYGIFNGGTIQSDVTTNAIYYTTSASTVASSFTLSSLIHYSAIQSTLGVGSSITTQTGFSVNSSLIGATTNYGFRGQIPSGTGRFNLYMDGTADNYLAGNTGIGNSATIVSSGPILTTTLTNGGSGYVDGTYTDVASTVVSGSGTYALFTIVVSGGIVTTATLTWGGSTYKVGTTLTVSNTLLGGTGSGLIITIDTVDFSQLTIASATGGDITLFRSDTALALGENLGTIKWNSNDLSSKASGLQAEIGAFGAGNVGGAYLSFFTRSATAGTSLVEAMRIGSEGGVGIGATALTGYSLRVSKSITGGINSYGIMSDGTIQSDVTTSVRSFMSQPSTAATSFTLPSLYHFFAVNGTLGAGSTITDQFGYFVSSSFTNGTNNYAFYSSLAAGTNRWNIYMNGTAANYMAGQVAIGTTTLNTSAKVQIDSTTQGFLPPRMTSAQRTAIATPATGLIVYQTDGTEGVYVYTSIGWKSLTMV